MGLTTFLTTIWVVHRNPPMFKILIFKEEWTSGDVVGHGVDVWGVKGVASLNLVGREIA
jgi:hypothetical protein